MHLPQLIDEGSSSWPACLMWTKPPSVTCLQLPNSEWVTPLLKMGVDQTAWSLFWNSTYYVLLGALKLESPATIAATVRNTWWDLLKAGWRLWPFVHIVTYGLLPVQHRLLFVDAVELVRSSGGKGLAGWSSLLGLASEGRLEGGGAGLAWLCMCAHGLGSVLFASYKLHCKR